MRKGLAEGNKSIPFTLTTLKKMEADGYKYVQVKGLTMDRHYDYIEPHFLVLVPMKELPSDQADKDIYEPVPSELLKKWASEKDEYMQIVIANVA